MRVDVLVDRIVLPDQLSVCGPIPLARLDLLEIHRCLAFTIPLRHLHGCVAGKELHMTLIAVSIGNVRTNLATIDLFLEVFL